LPLAYAALVYTSIGSLAFFATANVATAKGKKVISFLFLIEKNKNKCTRGFFSK